MTTVTISEREPLIYDDDQDLFHLTNNCNYCLIYAFKDFFANTIFYYYKLKIVHLGVQTDTKLLLPIAVKIIEHYLS